MNKKILFAIIVCSSLSVIAVTAVLAAPNRATLAGSCITGRILADGRKPSSAIGQITIGGLPGWFMFANSNTFRYSIPDINLCVNSKFTITPVGLASVGGIAQAKPKKTGLRYPQDCNYFTLTHFAQSCGLTLVEGSEHVIVKRPDGTTVTQIPRSVKGGGDTCRRIIKALNAECGGS